MKGRCRIKFSFKYGNIVSEMLLIAKNKMPINAMILIYIFYFSVFYLKQRFDKYLNIQVIKFNKLYPPNKKLGNMHKRGKGKTEEREITIKFLIKKLSTIQCSLSCSQDKFFVDN